MLRIYKRMSHKISGFFFCILLRVFFSPRHTKNLLFGGLSWLKIRVTMWKNVATVQTEINVILF